MLNLRLQNDKYQLLWKWQKGKALFKEQKHWERKEEKNVHLIHECRQAQGLRKHTNECWIKEGKDSMMPQTRGWTDEIGRAGISIYHKLIEIGAMRQNYFSMTPDRPWQLRLQ